MTNESSPNDTRNVWQNQKPEGIRMSVDEIRRRAGKLQKKIFWRNLVEYAAGLMVVVCFGFYFWRTSDALTRGALGLFIAGVLYVMWHLHRHGSSRSLPADLGLASGIEFYRRELERQRDLLASVWAWYLGPLIPGFVALRLALASPHHRHTGLYMYPKLASTKEMLLLALVFVLVWLLNHRAARRLQRQIDELNALQG